MTTTVPATNLAAARVLSPRRKTTSADSVEALVAEQLTHFAIDPSSEYGRALADTARSLYAAQSDVARLWEITTGTIETLPREDRIAYFNAKKFLSFQIAKILDTLQNPFRRTYQSLQYSDSTQVAKGIYPIFDNVTALFSATPVIARTATYIFACTEWVDDAFHGREPTHQIYSRLLNPTSIALANAIVDLECGPYAGDYLAWNFNSGMAAIDGMLSNVLKRADVLIVSRNIYGGVHQLLVDHFARKDKMAITLEWFEGTTGAEFEAFYQEVRVRHADRLAYGARLHVYLESPCNPHGYVLDVPAICRVAHKGGSLVMLDSTLATPVLIQPLQRKDKAERPDYVMHSYTKDISGNGAATSGVIIGENHRMFIPKGEKAKGVSWEQTMFWDVYYIKGAFLDADKASEVMNGMKTMELRVIRKAISTLVFTRFLASHPDFNVNSHAVPGNPNFELRERMMRHGLPSPLFTVDLEKAGFPKEVFVRFLDALEPTFSQQVSIGQCNTMLLCPGMTTHSELSEKAQKEARIFPTTMRISLGDEDPKELIAHLVAAARLHLDPHRPGFSTRFMDGEAADRMARELTLEMHARAYDAGPSFEAMLGR